ncbi:MAG: DPP IV N-terminal domain-containing protein [Verrucomicrobiae bacterium]|nr:DPP IV N-terminal domain-containing protein [Verrucomicrobiae bacterium]
MKLKAFCCVLGVCVFSALLSTAEDKDFAAYDQALSLRQRMSDLVYRAEVKTHWLADDRCWYRVQTGAQTHEFVLVNSETGVRQPAFDHEKLARALAKVTGQSQHGDNLPLSNLNFPVTNAFTFTVAGKSWCCNLGDYSLLAEKSTDMGEGPVRRLPGPRPSLRTGEETSLHFINRTTNEVKLFWMDPAGDRQFYAMIPAGGEREQNTYAGHVWLLTTGAGDQVAVFEAPDGGGDAIIGGDERPGGENPRRNRRGRQHDAAASPDGKWMAFVQDNNVCVRATEAGGKVFALSTNGTAEAFYSGEFHWSPDSQKLVAVQTTKGDGRKVYLVESSPKDQEQPKLLSYDYDKPGDKIPVPRPQLFDVAARSQIPVPDGLFTNAWSVEEIRWWPDSSRFTFLFNQRGHQTLRIVAVDAHSGEARAIVDEHSGTFIDYSGKEFSQYLDATHEIIWMSERDGWNHLYLYDAATGAVKNQITKGEWVVRGVDFVDETNRQIWFRAGGIVPGQDPYYIHFCRVNFDGSGLTVLTAGDGTHQAEFSPDRKFFVDAWSRVDAPPVTELRRSNDGKLVCELEQADIGRLVKAGWAQPERFMAKGRDGVTDIYGVIFRPTHFNPKRKYPVVENIYAGPQDSFAPKAFKPFYGQQEVAELGFIVVQLDGMGTSNRSKKFHDVCWKNLADAGFPDRILWIKAAAAKHPEMDLARVGIYGGSAGGQDAMRALLDHGDFYKVSVADCGCHDNRMDKIWWNEQWMGWPVDDSYARSSNVDGAWKLKGKLLLMVGELDHNVDPASTMQVVDALEKAGKDFEMLVITGSDHGSAETPYGKRRRADFLVRNLLGGKE